MADTKTTHLKLTKQDPSTMPDYTKDYSNLDTLDSEVWARGKAFNGTTVSADGEFHVRMIPYAENLETSASQKSDDSFILRTTGGEASITDGDAWVMLMKGTRVHTGYYARSIVMTPTWQQRAEGQETPTATINEDTFASYVTQNGTTTLTYTNDAWSATLSDYGVTVDGTPVNGDVINIAYRKEVRGTITQSDPTSFVSTGWNLYDYTNEYARLIKYSNEQGFKISGTYTALEFSETIDGTRTSISPVSGGFNPFGQNDDIGTTGYLWVDGGNQTDTAVWMTRSDWTSGYEWNSSTSTQGAFHKYTESTINIASFMQNNFPYGLLQVGTVQDEINLNIGVATSRVVRQAYNSTNLENAKQSGRQYEYDENYIYIERETPVTYSVTIDGGYTANDHGIEFFNGTDQDVYCENVYGANLKNKLERDVLTISQQTLDASQKAQVRANIDAFPGSYIVYSSTEPSNPVTGMIWLKPEV